MQLWRQMNNEKQLGLPDYQCASGARPHQLELGNRGVLTTQCDASLDMKLELVLVVARHER